MEARNKAVMVSIVCLVYNHESFLRQCLDGFVMQRTSFPFEAIVHDDYSTDGSADIIREYADRYPGIIRPYFEKENQFSKHDGSINRIIDSMVKGKYIALCEGDDYWTDPCKLQKQVDLLENNTSLSFCFHKCTVTSGKAYYVYPQKSILSAKDIILYHYIPTASLLYRAELRSNIDDFNLTVGDRPLEIQLAMQGDAYFMNEYMSVYRDDNQNSITHDKRHKVKSITVNLKLYWALLKKYTFNRNAIFILYKLLRSFLQLPLILRNVYLRK